MSEEEHVKKILAKSGYTTEIEKTVVYVYVEKLKQENQNLKNEIDCLKDQIEFWKQQCDDLEMQIGCMSDE